MKILEKHKSIKLRQDGYSLGEISSILKVSKSTISLWTKNIAISIKGVKRIKEKSIAANLKSSETLHKRKLARQSTASIEATKVFSEVKPDFNTGIIALSFMYWCEGSKDDRTLGFTNSDPDLVKIFLVLLRQSFKIDENKLRICMHLHDYHNEIEMQNFWSLITNIPSEQFNKTFKKKSKHKYTKDGYKGCVKITYHDAHISRVIQSFAKNLTKLYI
jgi:hypothetical protein